MGSCCEGFAASLRHKVVIQSVSQVTDGQGGFTETWADGATVWCSITPIKAYERVQAMQMQTPVSHKIVMRYRSDVTTANRLRFGSRVFEVKEAINVEERGRILQIKALEQA
ncbi:phage head closure protein [Tundrisphaera lichenicola]|uniref:phage head closure protein n=1 Tax=Tundrisphaera lichenicola TaxID=2029860 RepID=UPI003EBCA638